MLFSSDFSRDHARLGGGGGVSDRRGGTVTVIIFVCATIGEGGVRESAGERQKVSHCNYCVMMMQILTASMQY